MRNVAAAGAAALLLLGALPAAAAPIAVSPRATPLALRVTAESDAASDRDSFTRRAMEEMRAWQRKLQQAGATAATKTRAANDAAEKDLRKAWVDAKAASERLRVVSTEGWSHARATYEKAARDLAAAWRRLHGDEN